MTFRAMTEHAKNNRKPVYLPYSGATLLTIPLLNKDCAFSRSERIESVSYTHLRAHET